LEINNTNNRCNCLHKIYDKAQAKKSKIKKKKIFKMQKSSIEAETGSVYPIGTDMKELANNFVKECKKRRNEDIELKKDVVDIDEFLSKDYYNNKIKRPSPKSYLYKDKYF